MVDMEATSKLSRAERLVTIRAARAAADAADVATARVLFARVGISYVPVVVS